jgi:hypothetical protein
MKYSWAINLHGSDGVIYDNCILAFIGSDTVIRFQDADELKDFAERILRSIDEIKSLS